jgi:D-glycero-D-manno-heptose 1,7-bisphosphate phosphatase
MSRFKHVIDTPTTGTNYTTPTYQSTPQSTPYGNPQQQISQPQAMWPSVFPKALIGLEYDGVINIDNGKPITSPDQWVPIAGSLEAIRMMRLKGYKVVILSDQGGVKRGEQTHAQVDAMHNYAMQKFGEAGIFSIDGFFYAESDIKEDIFAKPNIGMFERTENDIFGGRVRFKNGGFSVGHRMKDLKAGLRAGATPVLVRTGQGEQTEEALQKFSAEKVRKKTKVFDNLLQFAQALK